MQVTSGAESYFETEFGVADALAEPGQSGVEEGEHRHERDVVHDDDTCRLACDRHAVRACLEHVCFGPDERISHFLIQSKYIKDKFNNQN